VRGYAVRLKTGQARPAAFKGLINLVGDLEGQKIHFQNITDGIDTKTPDDDASSSSLAHMGEGADLERPRAGLSRLPGAMVESEGEGDR
jgi:hypothetical protein